mmetsp:Transcript_86714/g.250439  ORF Transcript_86714/g.250439 Transcript_86714/m.250439 type:complete len:329 (+) Transcript_86714:148-1134(+)
MGLRGRCHAGHRGVGSGDHPLWRVPLRCAPDRRRLGRRLLAARPGPRDRRQGRRRRRRGFGLSRRRPRRHRRAAGLLRRLRLLRRRSRERVPEDIEDVRRARQGQGRLRPNHPLSQQLGLQVPGGVEARVRRPAHVCRHHRVFPAQALRPGVPGRQRREEGRDRGHRRSRPPRSAIRRKDGRARRGHLSQRREGRRGPGLRRGSVPREQRRRRHGRGAGYLRRTAQHSERQRRHRRVLGASEAPRRHGLRRLAGEDGEVQVVSALLGVAGEEPLWQLLRAQGGLRRDVGVRVQAQCSPAGRVVSAGPGELGHPSNSREPGPVQVRLGP